MYWHQALNSNLTSVQVSLSFSGWPWFDVRFDKLQTYMPNVVVNSKTTAGSMAISAASSLQGGLTVSSGATITTNGLKVSADGAVISSK